MPQHIIVDRRKNDKGKSTVNRQRYFRRVREQVREAVKETIRKGDIKDITNDKGKKVKITGKGLKQPQFVHNRNGGKQERVYPGNKEFTQGDRIKRPESGKKKGSGNKGSNDTTIGEDAFEFTLTREEFLDLFFEDLELPDLVKKQIDKIDEWTNHRAGFSVDGNPARLNILRSMKQSKSRRIALRTPKRKKIKKLEEELLQLQNSLVIYHKKGDNWETINEDEIKSKIAKVEQSIKKLKKRLKAVPFLDNNDLRYNRWEKIPVPATRAVMFAIMDVSASMGDWEKEMAKRFFMLLYLFLYRNYQHTDIIFIRHHTIATEVDEETFFHSKETGGTLVSTSLELMKDIIDRRYDPLQWNIFVCQASDGDNWPKDSIVAVDYIEKMLNYIQYYAYVEIDKNGGRDSDLWPFYSKVEKTHANFAMNVITEVNEIYPVFRKLFESKRKNAA